MSKLRSSENFSAPHLQFSNEGGHPFQCNHHPATGSLPAVPTLCHAAAPPRDNVATVYIVDDDEGMTELCSIVLEAAGYNVKAFNDRAIALAALKAVPRQPDLLITDYRGRSMLVDQFMQECLAVHPALRILMASGFDQVDTELPIRPKRYIRKPFTTKELLHEVQATLVE
jgi:DNA-binding NtrC family response regulator